MDLTLPEEVLDLQRAVREFAHEALQPHVAEWDRAQEFPVAFLRAMGELGLFGLPIPEEYGGAGVSTLGFVVALEELARVDASAAITVGAHTSLGALPILSWGSPEQRSRLLPRLASGEWLWAFALTEPEAGSDAGAVSAHARLEAGAWRLDGQKAFITNAGTELTGGVTVVARTGQRPDGRPEVSMLLVPQDSPGYTRARKYDKLGWRASDTRELHFDAVELPQDALLGERGGGYRQALETLACGRIGMAALSVGLAQACLDVAVPYARQRHAFGRPIASYQAISFRLADVATELELARLGTHRAAWLRDKGKDYRIAAAQAKLFASELSKRAADAAVQTMGGYGFMEESPVAKYWRDVKINEIGEGTSEILRILIARSLMPGLGI
jgi:butyryl-CoA dehydrogenase